MASAVFSGSSGPGSSPDRGHCVVFLGKTLYSHSCLYPSTCINGYRQIDGLASHPRGSRNTPSRFMLQKLEIKLLGSYTDDLTLWLSCHWSMVGHRLRLTT